jgi:methionyl-tRNA formyltransferase|tara:strand:+ start:1581 stop:2567 length:987 start_codon:yes stop_codon:yes gene_type:complete
LLVNFFDDTINREGLRVRVVFMGTSEFAVPLLEQLVLNGYPIVAVYTQPDRAAGRGRALVASPVKRVAVEWGLTVVQPVSLKTPQAVKKLALFQPDVIVVASFGQILPVSVLTIPAHGGLNIHPSLLPTFRGASPIASAILYGGEFTGVSVMLLDKGMDTGPVLARAQIPISARDTIGSLSAKLSLVGAQLLLEILPRWVQGELTPQRQDESQATYTRMLGKKDGEIDWLLSAIGIWRRVRALNPWPGCYTRWQGKRLKITESVPFSTERNVNIGRVAALDKGEAVFGVGTGAGVLGVLKVQLEGKRVMTAAEFLRGQKEFIGAVLPS